MDSRRKLIVVAGPTAVGKTAIAIALAQHFSTEIISADARQFYREMNIGTAKPTPEELQATPHHFIDSHSITQSYDAATFGDEALKCIQRLFENHSHVVMCGGSGLYIKAVLDGFDDIPEIDPSIRQDLQSAYEEGGLEVLQDKMKSLDPVYYEKIDIRNPQRLMRALEVVIGTGQSITVFQQRKRRTHDFDIVRIGLELPREELYKRIDLRMDRMIEEGLFEEASSLYPFHDHNALQTVGYTEIFDYMDGRYDRDEAIRLLKQHSRQYAKRQLTWFKRDPEMVWLQPTNINDIIDVASR
ncbi:tRNA (adenosine(37)-N6)-dimethylallyltransferase MiaA [Chryseolinea sp. T2]|uniref:tRNA (adenosine(37)-N6)-dimethylallyltransferase MiaA n=1 Tax=Chryseolinea sp. T2 TaxID=3129255 RepID=UPI00307826F3